MNILIDVNHPAHVHMFRCFAHEMISRGHQVLFTARDKEFIIRLLEAESLPFVNLGCKPKGGESSRILFNLKRGRKMYKVAKKFHADIFLSHGSNNAACIAWLMRKPAISFEDTFNMEQVSLYLPFVSIVLTGDYENPLKSPKVIKYAGYHELLYMHQNRFHPKSRDEVMKLLGLKSDERYVVVRFSALNATHDIGVTGFVLKNKILAVEQMSKYARVFISSESELPTELQKYKLPTNPEMIGHVIAHASLVFGESSTMTSEAAMLGVPSVHNCEERYLINDLSKTYGMCYWFSNSIEDQVAAIHKAVELLSRDPTDLAIEVSQRQKRMLDEKIDVTAWLCWLVENYPQSINKYRTHRKDIEKRFKIFNYS